MNPNWTGDPAPIYPAARLPHWSKLTTAGLPEIKFVPNRPAPSDPPLAASPPARAASVLVGALGLAARAPRAVVTIEKCARPPVVESRRLFPLFRPPAPAPTFAPVLRDVPTSNPGAALGGRYWLNEQRLLAWDPVYTSRPWFAQLLRAPEQPFAMGRPKALQIVERVQGLVGVPRALGLGLFGVPALDSRSSGRALSEAVVESSRAAQHRYPPNEAQKAAYTRAPPILEAMGGAVLVLDCGFGKTGAALTLAARLGGRTLWLAHNTTLVGQALSELGRWVPAARGALFESSADEHDFVFSTFQILQSRPPDKAFCRSFRTVVVDECHHAPAASFSQVLPMFPARYYLGLTATPDRQDGLGHMIYQLIGPPAVYWPRTPEVTGRSGTVEALEVQFDGGARDEVRRELSEFKQRQLRKKIGREITSTLDYVETLNRLLMDPERLAVAATLVELFRRRGRRVLVLSQRIEASHEAFPAVMEARWGYRPAVLLPKHCTSLLDGSRRPEYENALAEQVVCATEQLLGEGFSEPRFDVLFLLSIPHNKVQTVGRLERSYPGKPRPVVVYLADSFAKFPWYATEMRKALKSKGALLRRGNWDSLRGLVEGWALKAAPEFGTLDEAPVLASIPGGPGLMVGAKRCAFDVEGSMEAPKRSCREPADESRAVSAPVVDDEEALALVEAAGYGFG
jgi:superfamily II DNA or RNA helicase